MQILLAISVHNCKLELIEGFFSIAPFTFTWWCWWCLIYHLFIIYLYLYINTYILNTKNPRLYMYLNGIKIIIKFFTNYKRILEGMTKAFLQHVDADIWGIKPHSLIFQKCYILYLLMLNTITELKICDLPLRNQRFL